MERIPQSIKDKLFPYQLQHLILMINAFVRHLVAIDSSDTGTGKTYVSVALCILLGLRPFVVCPKPVVKTWYHVFDLFGVTPLGIVNYESAKNGKYYESAAAFDNDVRANCPYIDAIKDDDGETDFIWNLPQDAILIFDEAHKGKNAITVNSQFLASAKQILKPHAPAHSPRILVLSATITDKVDNFRTVAYLLGLSQFGKHAFKCWLRSLRDGDPEQNLAEKIHHIVYNDLTGYGSRMKITDIKANHETQDLFKNNDVLAETYLMSPEAEEQIEAAYAEIAEALTALKNKMIVEDCILTILLRARQRIEMLKIPTIVELAMERLLEDKSVVIFVNFNETIESLFSLLKDFLYENTGSFVTFIHGGQTVEEREYNIKAFQADRSRLMIANVKAGGVGVSLHDLHGNYQRVALHSPGWSSIDFKQALGRIYRADAKTDAIQRIIYCKGRTKEAPGPSKNDCTFGGSAGGKVGVEELIADNVNKKLRTIEWINNGNEENLQLIAEAAVNEPAN